MKLISKGKVVLTIYLFFNNSRDKLIFQKNHLNNYE